MTEEELVKRCSAGDQVAFRQLVKKHLGVVEGVCHRLVPTEADDLAQEVWLKVFLHLGSFKSENGAKFNTWLYRVAVNICMNYLRHRRYRQRANVDIPSSLNKDPTRREVTENQADTQGLEEILEAKGLAEEIEIAFSYLNAKQQEVLRLTVQGLNPDEISKMTGTCKSTVCTRLHHARRKLSRLLQTS